MLSINSGWMSTSHTFSLGILLPNVTLKGLAFLSVSNLQCYTWTCDVGRIKDKFNWTLSETTSKQPQNLDHLTSNPASPSKNSCCPQQKSQKASLHCRTSAGRSSLKQPCSTQPCMVTESKGPLISSKLWPHRSTNNGQVWLWKWKPFFGDVWVGLVGGISFSGGKWWHIFDIFWGGGSGCCGDNGENKLEMEDCETWKCKRCIYIYITYNSSYGTPSQHNPRYPFIFGHLYGITPFITGKGAHLALFLP